MKLPRYANRRGDSSSSARRRRRRPAREGSRSIRPLQAWRKRLAELVLKAGIGWHQDALVFPGLRSGSVVQPYEPEVVSGIVSRLARKAEMPANIAPLHGLRHRHASSLMSLHLRLVADRLGHSTVWITADLYEHGDDADARAAADAALGALVPSVRKP